MLRSRFRNVNMNIFNVIVNADTHTICFTNSDTKNEICASYDRYCVKAKRTSKKFRAAASYRLPHYLKPFATFITSTKRKQYDDCKTKGNEVLRLSVAQKSHFVPAFYFHTCEHFPFPIYHSSAIVNRHRVSVRVRLWK